ELLRGAPVVGNERGAIDQGGGLLVRIELIVARKPNRRPLPQDVGQSRLVGDAGIDRAVLISDGMLRESEVDDVCVAPFESAALQCFVQYGFVYAAGGDDGNFEALQILVGFDLAACNKLLAHE